MKKQLALLAAMLMLGCAGSEGEGGTVGLNNITNLTQFPEAVNTSSNGLFGIGILIAVFMVQVVVLSQRNKREDAIMISLFPTLIVSGILVSLDVVTNAAPVVLLALLGLALGYTFLRK